MKSKLIALLAFAFIPISAASADLVINISGVAGSGITTLEFLTLSPSTASFGSTVRGDTASSWFPSDTTQFGGGNAIVNSAIQNQLFAMSLGATLTVGGTTENLTSLFLDDDGTGAGDDLGIRVENPLAYSAGDSVSWAGTSTINLDITEFVEGTYQMNFGALWFLDQGNTVVNIAQTIPEPFAPALLALASIGAMSRRRR